MLITGDKVTVRPGVRFEHNSAPGKLGHAVEAVIAYRDDLGGPNFNLPRYFVCVLGIHDGKFGYRGFINDEDILITEPYQIYVYRNGESVFYKTCTTFSTKDALQKATDAAVG